MKTKSEKRSWRKNRIRKKIHGNAERPRLSVFRSATHIYAQVIDDEAHHTLLAVSSLSSGVVENREGTKTDIARKVGALVAQKCIENKIDKVVFDRNGFVFHGRIQALAEAARKAGLKF